MRRRAVRAIASPSAGAAELQQDCKTSGPCWGFLIAAGSRGHGVSRGQTLHPPRPMLAGRV